MTRALLILALAAAPLDAAVIRGTVVENYTGKLLTRALVVLQPVGAAAGQEQTARTGRLGNFAFSAPPGVYVLKVSRRGFLPAEYGQKRWNSAGEPIVVEESANTFLNVRMMRYGAVSGTVVDENDIGLPDHDVVVYRMTKPPEAVGHGTTDDRGRYRVGGLMPGKYVVRTGGGRYEDGSYLPTYSRETGRMDQARIFEVFIEEQTAGVDIRPLPGQTYSVSVGISTDPPRLPVLLTIASAAGRRTVEVVEGHTFTGLGPGDYEVYAETLPDYPHQGAYQRLQVPGAAVNLICEPETAVGISGDSREKGTLWYRRKDHAGAGQTVAVAGEDAKLVPGRWELLLRPPDGTHVSGVFGSVYRRERPDGWNEAMVARYSRPQIRIAGGAGAVRGVVKDGAYAPVYLEAYDVASGQRVGELWTARADAQGRYRFENLGPGSYRLVATFEYNAPDTETITLANPASVTVDAHGVVQKDIDLFVIR